VSVRAIAIRSGPRALRAAGHAGPQGRRRPARRDGWRLAFTDDRRLIVVKLILVGLLALAMMALEVPW
jgi:hypothetical protein